MLQLSVVSLNPIGIVSDSIRLTFQTYVVFPLGSDTSPSIVGSEFDVICFLAKCTISPVEIWLCHTNPSWEKWLKTIISAAHLWDWGSAHHLQTVNLIMSCIVVLSNLVPVSTLKSCIYIWNTSWAGLHRNNRTLFNSSFSWAAFFLHLLSPVLFFCKHINQHHLYSLSNPTCSVQNYLVCIIFSPYWLI